MSKQKSLAAFGFSKTVVHRGVANRVFIPEYVDEVKGTINCSHCTMKFKTKQGLAVHAKCKHPSFEPAEKKVRITKESLSTSSEKSISIDSIVRSEVQDVLNGVVGKVVGIVGKSEGTKQPKGKKRHGYTAQFKAEVIHACDSPNESQLTVAERFGVSQSQVSRWMKDRINICRDACDKLRKLHKKGRKLRKYTELYPKMWEVFKTARATGKRVSFHWLWTKARVLHKESTDFDVCIKAHVVVRFLQIYNVKMRARHRNKKKAKEDMVDSLKKWHSTLCERCIKTGMGKDYDVKWGHFTPAERINVDQSPLPFVLDVKKTYDYVEPKDKHHNTWISQPGSGLDKRQCSLQVMFRATGKQPPISIIFRGKGMRISEDERKAWHPDVKVFFQTNAWMDHNVNMDWAEQVLF